MSKERLELQADGGVPVVARPAIRRMETITCTVRNAGDIRNEVVLRRVTPPEVLVLRRIHGGAEAVVNCVVDGMCTYTPAGEKQRLTMRYNRYAKDIDLMFPGISPELVTTLAEIEEMAAVELGRAEAAMEVLPAGTDPQLVE